MRTQDEAHRNLLQLRNFLLDLPHRKFHMPKWVSDDATESSCGTAGCAAGWAATIFHSKGWRIFDGIVWLANMPGSPAFAEFFYIDSDDAKWITSGFHDSFDDYPGYLTVYGVKEGRDITPFHVADRITKVIAKYAPHLLMEPVAAAEMR